MKKIFFILMMMTFLFFLFSCQNQKYTIDDVLDEITIGFQNNDTIDRVTGNIVLPTKSNLIKDAEIFWTSSLLNIIGLEGNVNRLEEDVVVTLTVFISYDYETRSKAFSVTVKGTISYQEVMVNIFIESLDLGSYELFDSSEVRKVIGSSLFPTDYELEGFSINLELSSPPMMVTSDLSQTFDVYFDRNIYEITYIVDDLEYEIVEFAYGVPTEAIDDPAKEDFVFLGWSISPVIYQSFEFGNFLAQNITLYAFFSDGNSYVGYYEGADNLLGNQLTTFLRSLLNSNLKTVSYGDARYILNITDRDPNNASNVILVYRGTSVSGTWDGGVTWNREHVWPQSLLNVDTNNSSTHIGADLHNLKPANPSENTSRGNKFFDITTTTQSYAPRAEVRGDVARILLYMITRYDYLTLVNTIPATFEMGKKDVLLRWHLEDPVDDFERNRNNVIYQYQGNRNPFIDHPEFVEKIWGPITLTNEDEGIISTLSLYKVDNLYFLEIKNYTYKKDSFII